MSEPSSLLSTLLTPHSLCLILHPSLHTSFLTPLLHTSFLTTHHSSIIPPPSPFLTDPPTSQLISPPYPLLPHASFLIYLSSQSLFPHASPFVPNRIPQPFPLTPHPSPFTPHPSPFNNQLSSSSPYFQNEIYGTGIE